jgi:CDGSH-type Zn-finger protein
VCRARLEYSPGAVEPPPVRADIGYDSDGEQAMAEPIPAQKEPYGITVEAGKRYFWCACGRSANQPFCDGSHQGTGLTPVPFTAAASEEVWLCGCKQTSGKPFCDGTHNGL